MSYSQKQRLDVLSAYDDAESECDDWGSIRQRLVDALGYCPAEGTLAKWLVARNRAVRQAASPRAVLHSGSVQLVALLLSVYGFATFFFPLLSPAASAEIGRLEARLATAEGDRRRLQEDLSVARLVSQADGLRNQAEDAIAAFQSLPVKGIFEDLIEVYLNLIDSQIQTWHAQESMEFNSVAKQRALRELLDNIRKRCLDAARDRAHLGFGGEADLRVALQERESAADDAIEAALNWDGYRTALVSLKMYATVAIGWDNGIATGRRFFQMASCRETVDAANDGVIALGLPGDLALARMVSWSPNSKCRAATASECQVEVVREAGQDWECVLECRVFYDEPQRIPIYLIEAGFRDLGSSDAFVRRIVFSPSPEGHTVEVPITEPGWASGARVIVTCAEKI